MKDKKKVVFYEYEYKYANFKIRLSYDKINQNEFFKFLIEEYVNNNHLMLKLIEDFKIRTAKMGRAKLKDTAKDFDQGRTLLEELGITNKEKETIFDMIEEEDSDW